MSAVIGLDPGFTGALAVLYDDGRVIVHDAPIVEISGRRQMDLHKMVGLLRDITLEVDWIRLPHFFIERVHSFPGSSGRSMFSFGEGYGAWQGIAVALGFPLTRVEPARWKGALMDGMGKDKDAARFRASLLFPAYAHLFARKQDDGRAEALLIAEFGRRSLK